MSKQSYQQLMELSWKRELTPAEKKCLQAHLAAHSEDRRHWEKENRLNQLLRDLPSVAVSSNFTARVLQAAQKAPRKKMGWLERAVTPFQNVSKWLPRFAAATLMLSCVTLVSVHQYQVHQQAKLASDVAKVSQMANLPEMDSLRDFETIERLSRVEVSDGDLLSALR